MKQPDPIIISRSDHPISRKQISPNALKVLYRLRDSGFIAYLVGGCVRDLLLGREPKDFDVVTDATPNQIKRIFRNCRLIGRRFRLAHLHFNDEIIEVATFRSAQPVETEGEEPATAEAEGEFRRPPRHLKNDDGMVLRDNVFGSPVDDALRRDFTVNALTYNIADFSIIDYAGGMDDLKRGIIRLIGDPQTRFTEDPVRMIRAVRFAAMLGFTIEDVTLRVLLELAPTINRAAPARLFEEVLKLFLLGEGEKCFQLLRQTGIFQALFPGFSAWLDSETGGFPHTRPGEGLDWIDRRIQQGGKVSPPLFLALFFGPYIEENAEVLRRSGANHQQALSGAMAEFLGETATTVLIPNKIGVAARDILTAQLRFRKTPGRNATGFAHRHGFADALDYLRFSGEKSAEARKLAAWWERFAGENAAAPAVPEKKDSILPESTGKKRRRKRRRGRGGAENSGK